MRKPLLILVIILFSIFHLQAQIKFYNPGLKGVPGENVAPYFWHICDYSPDINPVSCCPWFIPAFEGGTYAGFGCGNKNGLVHESIGQKLSCNLIKGKMHHFSLYAYHTKEPLWKYGQIEFWGGHQLCSKKKLLWSGTVTDTFWRKFDVSFLSDDNYEYILFTGTACDTCERVYIGLDALSDITIEGVTFPSAGNIMTLRDTICKGTPAILTVNSNTDSVQWQSSFTNNNFTDISNAIQTTYNAAPLQTTYYRVYTKTGSCDDTSAAYKIVVAPSPVAAFSYINDSLQTSFNSDSSKGAVSYEWDFGDGTKGSEANPVHTFSSIDSVYHVCLTVTNGSNCSFTVCHNTNEVNGIERIKQGSVTLYPNPATGQLEISGLRFRVSEIEVRNVLGQVVFAESIRNLKSEIRNFQMDVSKLNAGIYFVQIKTKNGTASGKFVKE